MKCGGVERKINEQEVVFILGFNRAAFEGLKTFESLEGDSQKFEIT